MATQRTAAGDQPGEQTESPWTREDVVHLLRAWRVVAANTAASSENGAGGGDPTPSSVINARIFEKLQEVVDAGTTPARKFKSLVKTRKSLLRSYRFIAVFNQNHIIAKSMSAAFGGQNWFALPQDEQRRVVDAHYKRKPFAYIDEEIFDAIELILEIEQHPATQEQVPIKRERSTSPDPHALEAKHEHRTEADTTPTHYSMDATTSKPNSQLASSSQKLNTTWSREDMLVLIRAWDDVLDNPRGQDEQIAVFDNHVYEKFVELSGGDTTRSALAVKIKRYALIPTFQFISDFNQNKIPVKKSMGQKKWHALSRKDQTRIIQEHYKKSHCASIDEDMLPMIQTIIRKTKKVEMVKSSAPAGELRDTPWTRRETLLLLRAWSDIMAGTRGPSDPMSALDSRIYRRFVVLGEGETTRTESEMATRKEELVNTHEMISALRLDGDTKAAEESWFSLRRSERKTKISSERRPCTDIDEATYKALGRILQKRQQPADASAAASPSAPVSYTKAMMMWSREEVLQVLQAWTEVLDDPPVSNESAVAFNDRVCQKFLALCNGNTIRSVKAMQAKRESIINSYQFISDFNQNKLVLTGAMRAWGTNDWFSISHEEQKNLVKAHYKKVSFSYLYSDMLPAVEKIIQKTPTVEKDSQLKNQKLETRAPGIVYPKPRPNSWTPEELRHFLRAWREAVSDSPRQPDESVTSFNARIYKRFQVLCGGRSKKAEVSLLTKRKTLTTTFEFISEYNRKHGSDRAEGGPKAAWFSLSDLERKKMIVSANKITFSCTNIDEETFSALESILGEKGDDEESDESPSIVVSDQPRADVDESVKTDEYPRENSFSRKDSNTGTVAIGALLNTPKSTSAKRKRGLVAKTVDPANQGILGRLESNGETRSRLSSPVSSAESAEKKQKVEPDLRALVSIFETQTQHLTSLLLQIREENRLEEEARSQILEQIRLDHEERRNDREERKLERAQMQAEWGYFREQSRVEREQTRALLSELLGQKEDQAQDTAAS